MECFALCGRFCGIWHSYVGVITSHKITQYVTTDICVMTVLWPYYDKLCHVKSAVMTYYDMVMSSEDLNAHCSQTFDFLCFIYISTIWGWYTAMKLCPFIIRTVWKDRLKFWWDRVLACLVTSPWGKLVNRPITKRVPNLSANNS
jgi:hypothetical protein